MNIYLNELSDINMEIWEEIRMKKVIVIGVIALFIFVGFQQAFASESFISTDIIKEELEPKDYLFDTIVTIANNPEVKELFEEYGNNIYDLDYNYKGIFLQILFRNPSLLFSKLFTKPKITDEYLNSVVNEGCEIVDIIGEDKALEIIKSIEIPNPILLDELDNIIMKNEELSNRISTLKIMNEELKTDEPFLDYPIICFILALIIIRSMLKMSFVGVIFPFIEENPILSVIFRVLGYFNFGVLIIACSLLYIFSS